MPGPGQPLPDWFAQLKAGRLSAGAWEAAGETAGEGLRCPAGFADPLTAGLGVTAATGGDVEGDAAHPLASSSAMVPVIPALSGLMAASSSGVCAPADDETAV
jgi:hypothetical protein